MPEDPFGQSVLSIGAMADVNPFGFSTKYRDPETQLLYYGYRYLDVKTAKWISRDPLGFKGGLNLYAFADNNSPNVFDPLGLEALTRETRGAILLEVQRIADKLDRMQWPELEPMALGRLKHKKFQELLSQSKYSEFILTEQSINAAGQAVKRQHWIRKGREYFKWPKGSRRPDVMILMDSKFKKQILSGRSRALRGKVEAVIDFKTGAAGIVDDWAEVVARRLGLHKSLVLHAKSGGRLKLSYLRRFSSLSDEVAEPMARRLVKTGAAKGLGKALVVVGVVWAYQHAKAEGMSEEAARAYALGSAVNLDIAYDAIDAAGDAYWRLAEKVALDTPSGEHIDALYRALNEQDDADSSSKRLNSDYMDAIIQDKAPIPKKKVIWGGP